MLVQLLAGILHHAGAMTTADSRSPWTKTLLVNFPSPTESVHLLRSCTAQFLARRGQQHPPAAVPKQKRLRIGGVDGGTEREERSGNVKSCAQTACLL